MSIDEMCFVFCKLCMSKTPKMRVKTINLLIFGRFLVTPPSFFPGHTNTPSQPWKQNHVCVHCTDNIYRLLFGSMLVFWGLHCKYVVNSNCLLNSEGKSPNRIVGFSFLTLASRVCCCKDVSIQLIFNLLIKFGLRFNPWKETTVFWFNGGIRFLADHFARFEACQNLSEQMCFL